MKRRWFLRVLGLGLSGIMMLPFRLWGKSEDFSIVRSFYVAGVRFNATLDILKVDDDVIIKRESWHGESCCGIYTKYGQRIGYVPRELIQSFDTLGDLNWKMVCVDRYAVPWKRYKIAQRTAPSVG